MRSEIRAARVHRASRRPLLGHLWLGATTGVAITVIYLGFAATAYRAYPGRFSAWNNNWLSDLGNRDLNPTGAAYYALGCGLAGALLIVLFGGLNVWRDFGTTVTNRLLLAVQALGMVSGVGLVMTAVYTEDRFAQHQFWSRVLFGGFAMTLFVTPFALRRPGRRRVVLNTVCLVGYLAVVASAVAADAHWIEWICVSLFLLYVLVVGFATSTLPPAARRPRG